MSLLALEHWGIRKLDRLAGRFGRGAALPEHLAVGLRGEREALFHLQRLGCTVVGRRWTSSRVRGDLDLIAWCGATLCFIEVKSRTARDSVAAEAAVDRSKRMQLRRLAAGYLKAFDEPGRGAISTRFDVISVYLLASGTEIEVLEDAFGWSERHAGGW